MPENRTRFELRDEDRRPKREREWERRRGGTTTAAVPGLTRKTVTDEERPRDLLEER
jgi:hypothetical protein